MSQVKTAQDGFSLVEIIVAIMVLSFGLLAMAASTGYVFAELRNNTFSTQRTLAKQEMVEQLRGMFWADIPSAATTTTIGRFTLTYSATTPTNTIKRVTIITRGPAYRAGRGTYTTVSDTTRVEIMRPI